MAALAEPNSEALTLAVVGAFLGGDSDEGLDAHCRRHYPDCLPALRRVYRTTFVRQAANLWKRKEALWPQLRTRVAHDPLRSRVDRCPLPVCRFARAPRCRRLREHRAYGDDERARQTYDGLRFGCPLGGRPVAEARVPAGWHTARWGGLGAGARNDGREETMTDRAARGVRLLAPDKTKTHERASWPRWLTQTRRRIATVLGQRVARYHTKRVGARDAWHLWSRGLRCVLSDTVAVLLCQSCGRSPLPFDTLLTA